RNPPLTARREKTMRNRNRTDSVEKARRERRDANPGGSHGVERKTGTIGGFRTLLDQDSMSSYLRGFASLCGLMKWLRPRRIGLALLVAGASGALVSAAEYSVDGAGWWGDLEIKRALRDLLANESETMDANA